MDPTTVRLKVYNKSLEGVLRILKETSWRIADDDSRDHILKTIRRDLKDLFKYLEEYEEKLAS